MTNHTIEAKFTGESLAKARKPQADPMAGLVQAIADALRSISQVQCADEYERQAHGILAALRILGERQAAVASAVKAKIESEQTAKPESKPVGQTAEPESEPAADDVKPTKAKGKPKD